MPASAEMSLAPQELVLDLLGLHVLGRAKSGRRSGRPVPTQAFLTVLGALDVSDSATRTTLNRMVARGVLVRHKQGRTSAFEPAEETVAMLRRGRARMFAAAPFDHDEDVWTIVSCPIPESRRNLRYHLQARLSWAGFGAPRANLWVAPGRIDVEQLLGDLPETALSLVHAFHGTPAPPSNPEHLVHSAWDPDTLRRAHFDFAAHWEDERSPAAALPRFLRLLDEWGRLLRTDPGLPAAHLDDEWPAKHSAQIFQRLEAQLGPLAEAELEQLVRSAADGG
jgi:phenylacetic acid degradation operon negative regulatory protein